MQGMYVCMCVSCVYASHVGYRVHVHVHIHLYVYVLDVCAIHVRISSHAMSCHVTSRQAM